ncbi:MAG: hypothetical protein UR28_C0016G0025 [Candidatus Peregrinibacteria bacterium GW2011_GWF2_33_10]|nr:MAG: hypothetical protein UR28_C0016G0025 [Candidatus Peregrinibacteria bacterium GW2011_GWF2_33_10]OGJ45828.1 MAG: hypothetical protein A2263_03480 [Candidatus Peregrinibacteria bacterium RIFOXYA2_FULL_33_21]OGJ46792.1 MAG: hypothetical protein A2272_06095 [Candidatus Peregrinibacteria bacterium RIFOXYA12_FULL_33_12]OGJ51381.1 MAG: hypothetical protein A2307_02420 [Candidatus Peregrinibacteria bacterium RIFOXYB2_FULL_33_20]
MKTNTANKILDYLTKQGPIKANDIIQYLQISPQATFKQLKNLYSKNLITKSGTPPKVFYQIAKTKLKPPNINLPKKIDETYLIISPEGELLEGTQGFGYFCNKNNLNINKTADEYLNTLKKYDKFKNNGLIDGMSKLKKTFKNIYLDEIYYLDFYSIERFGKTKLGNLVLYAKQSQNKALIYKIYQLIKEKISNLIKEKHIDAIAFIPPTIPRKIQFQKELEKLLTLKIPKFNIVKILNQIPIAQKTLNKLEDRIENVETTIFIDDKKSYKNILLIDDAVGSGATLNETAKKIREKNLVKANLIGLALVGSFKGFDIINEI